LFFARCKQAKNIEMKKILLQTNTPEQTGSREPVVLLSPPGALVSTGRLFFPQVKK
jgi:hypothetical protein